MQKEQQQLAELVKGKKVAFIGAGVSHKTLIEEFVGLGAQVTLCDKKNSVEDFGDYADTIRRLGIDLSLGEHYMDGFKGQDIILRTPGFEYYQKPLQDAIAAGDPGAGPGDPLSECLAGWPSPPARPHCVHRAFASGSGGAFPLS